MASYGRMIGELRIGTGFGSSRSSRDLVIIPVFIWRYIRKPRVLQQRYRLSQIPRQKSDNESGKVQIEKLSFRKENFGSMLTWLLRAWIGDKSLSFPIMQF